VDNPLYKEAEATLNKLNIQRVVLLQDYKPESNEVQRLDTEIAAVQKQMQGFSRQTMPSKTMGRNKYLDQYINATIENTAATAKMRALSGVMASRNQKLVTMPEKQRQYAILAQKVAFLDKAYQTLSDKYYALVVNEKSTLSGALFAANAWPPEVPTNSKRKKLPKLAILALMLAAGVVLLAEKLDKTVRDETRIMRLSGEEPMAVIPKVKGLTNPFTRLVDTEDHSIFLEAFRILRNSIYYANPNGAPKLLAITSPGHGEGKSTTSLCLSITMAMDGKKVLLIDCDFRRPSLYKWIKASTDLGLSYVLAGEASVDEAIIPTSAPNLFCLPAGPLPANPSEFLNSRISRETMNKLANEYDMVILDCPPCAGLSDMQIISRLVDGVLLVASIDHTLKKRLDEGFRMLSKVHAPLIGYVINRFNMNPHGYDYYASEDCDLPKWKNNETKVRTDSNDIVDRKGQESN
jgi:capsular exopolysaccharide synthesis family protein